MAQPEGRVQPEPLVDEFITASRALLGLAVRSISAAPVELTPPQHRLLVLLAGGGEQTVGALAAQLGVNPSNASRLCDRLQRLALVTRRRSTSDARAVKVALTTEGREVLDAVSAHRRREVARILATLPDHEVRAVVHTLRAFNEAAHELADRDWPVVDGRTAREPGP